jgi:hypothetical protein
MLKGLIMARFDLSSYEGKYIPQSGDTYIDNALDGSGVRKFLEQRGYKVISNRDTGRNGEAVTACGYCVSTNGHVSFSREGALAIIKATGLYDMNKISALNIDTILTIARQLRREALALQATA